MARPEGPANAQLEPIATLPLFFKLRGKRAVLAGGSMPAVWKAELLSAAGAAVEVFAEDPVPLLVELAARPPDGPITLVRRHWDAADLPGAAIALGAIEDDGEAASFQVAARLAGVPVNVIDKPAFCDFQFGTIVSRSPLMIGISTDGAAPVFGQAIRARIEAVAAAGVAALGGGGAGLAPVAAGPSPRLRGRRRFWEAFAERALDGPPTPPHQDDFDACLDAAQSAPPRAAPPFSRWSGPGQATPTS